MKERSLKNSLLSSSMKEACFRQMFSFKRFLLENEDIRHQFHLSIDEDKQNILYYADWLEDHDEKDLADYLRLALEDPKSEELEEMKERLGYKLANLPLMVHP